MDDVAGGVGVRLDSGQQQSGTGTGGPGACVQGVGGRPVTGRLPAAGATGQVQSTEGPFNAVDCVELLG